MYPKFPIYVRLDDEPQRITSAEELSEWLAQHPACRRFIDADGRAFYPREVTVLSWELCPKEDQEPDEEPARHAWHEEWHTVYDFYNNMPRDCTPQRMLDKARRICDQMLGLRFPTPIPKISPSDHVNKLTAEHRANAM